MSMNTHADNSFAAFLQEEQRLIAQLRSDRSLQASLRVIREELLPALVASPARAFDRQLMAILWPELPPTIAPR